MIRDSVKNEYCYTGLGLEIIKRIKMVLMPKKAAEFIASKAKNVKIVSQNIEKLGDILVQEINSGKLSSNNFSQVDVHPTSDKPWAIDWIFLVDTLNFCFWHNENEEGWKVNGYSGYFALCAAINRAQDENVCNLFHNYSYIEY